MVSIFPTRYVLLVRSRSNSCTPISRQLSYFLAGSHRRHTSRLTLSSAYFPCATLAMYPETAIFSSPVRPSASREEVESFVTSSRAGGGRFANAASVAIVLYALLIDC